MVLQFKRKKLKSPKQTSKRGKAKRRKSRTKNTQCTPDEWRALILARKQDAFWADNM